jgi:hypothetical protein
MPSSGPDDRAMRVGSQTVAVLAVSRKIREAWVAHVRDEVRQIAESGAIPFVVEAASAE